MKKVIYTVIVCMFFLLSISSGVYAQDQDEIRKEQEAFKKKMMEMTKRNASQDEILREAKAYKKKVQEIEANKGLSTYMGQGRYYEVIAFHKKEIEACSQGKIENVEYMSNASVCFFKNHAKLGDAYMEIGFYEEALEHYLLAIKYQRDRQKEFAATIKNMPNKEELSSLINMHKVGEFEILIRMSKNFMHLNNYDEVLKCAREASSIKGSESYEQMMKRHHVFSENKYTKGIIEKSNRVFISVTLLIKIMEYLNLADMYTMSGNDAEALKSCDEGLKAIDEVVRSSKDGPPVLGLLGSSDTFLKKGTIQMRMNNYPAAELSFREAQRALDQYKKIVAENPELQKEEAKWYAFKFKIEKDLPYSLVSLALATGRYQEALTRLNNIDIRGNDVLSDGIVYHTQRGEALSHLGQTKDASTEYLKAILLVEEARGRLRKSQEGFLGTEDRIKPYRGLVSALAERAFKGDLPDPSLSAYGRDLKQSAFYFAESTKARALLDVMAASGRRAHDATIPKDLEEKEAMLAGELFALEGKWSAAYSQGETALAQLRQKKQQLTSELNTLIRQIRQDYPRYGALKYPSPITAENIPLKANEVLIEYALGDKAAFVFVVHKGGVVKLIKLPVGKEALEAKVKSLVEPLNRQQFSMQGAKELGDILVAPIMKELKPTDQLIIIPDGALGLLPFEILVLKQGRDMRDTVYVGDRYGITYSQSATVLALQRLLPPSQAPQPLFALGNPIYNKNDQRYLAYKEGKPQPVPSSQNLTQYALRGLATRREFGQVTSDDPASPPLAFRQLPGTEDEVKAITAIFNVQPIPPDVLLGVYANETTFKQTPLKDYRYLHFATHADLGRLQGINEPFIILSQVENKGKDNGFLTLSKVLGIKLNADMVVLSACLTGGGKILEGEGVANFARAFQHAGSRSVVVSLWEVPDREAVEYMKTFYSYLKAGKPRSEAMCLTRASMKARYSNPYYWGMFILHGEG